MMKIKHYSILLGFLLTFLFALTSCESRFEAKNSNDTETPNSGKLSIQIDEEISPLIDSALVMYKQLYKNVELKSGHLTSRKAMASLLSGQSRAVIVARNYLHDEDSLMKVYKVEKHQKIKIADDALVFFVNTDSKLDTLNQNEIIKHFNEENDLLNSKFVISNINSSVYANFEYFIKKQKIITKKLTLLKTSEEVITQVEKNKDNIGIAFLSQIAKNEKVKALKISYYDSLHVFNKGANVHQSSIVQKQYPFVVGIYAYLLENHQNLPFWFATYLGKDFKVQKIFLDAGIVPAYAVIKLKYEE